MKKQTFMQSLIVALVLLLGVTALTGCGSDNDSTDDNGPDVVEETTAPEDEATDETEEDPEDETAEEDPEENLFGDDNFTMVVPEGWSIVDSFIFAPDGVSNVNVVAEGMQGMTLDEYVDASFDALIAIFEDLYLFADDDFYVGGVAGGIPGILIAYESALIEAYATYQFFLDVNGVAYIITYTSFGEVSLAGVVGGMVDTFVAR